jgi:hypothetical protein
MNVAVDLPLLANLRDVSDDRTVEDRYPKVAWSRNPRVRSAQRKCYLLAEHCRDHPEAEADIVAKNRAFDARTKGFTEGGIALQQYAGERLAGAQPPLVWDDIERTAPSTVREKLTRGARRGMAAQP